MEALVDIQNDLFKQIQRLKSNLEKSPKDRITQAYLETRLSTLNEYWEDFKQHHKKILQLPKKERETQSYFTVSLYDECSDIYLDLSTKVREQLNMLKTVISQQPQSHSSNPTQHKVELKTKLPPIQIPKFSGSYKEWLSFHDLYNSIIHQSNTLSDVQKYHYLKTNLSGEAEQLLKHLPVTEANYKPAWEILQKRYNNQRCIAATYMERLLSQRKITTESPKAIRELLDTTIECLETLKTMKLDTDSWGVIIAHVIISKLDAESHKQFELLNRTSETIPTWTEVASFLESRFRTLEALQPRREASKDTVKSHATTTSTFRPVKCIHCNDDHYVFHCKEFANLEPQERKTIVEKARVCYNCLVPKHPVKLCRQQARCRICGRKHHTLLHDAVVMQNTEGMQRLEIQRNVSHNTNKSTATTTSEREEKKTPQDSTGIASLSTHLTDCYVMLATALIKVQSPDGRYHTLRALIDPASQGSMITEAACQLLHLERSPVSANITGIDNEVMKSSASGVASFDISPRNNTNIKIPVIAYVMKRLTSPLPPTKITIDPWLKFKQLELADPTFTQPGQIDLILGARIYTKLIEEGVRKYNNGEILAQASQLGWLITGFAPIQNTSTIANHTLVVAHCNVELNNLLRAFWEVENDTHKRMTMSHDEKKCEEYYKDTLTRDEEGRYIVRLPFKQEPPTVGTSRQAAVGRQIQIEKRLESEPKLKNQYIDFMQDYLAKGHMEKVEPGKIKQVDSYYLPHHAVVHESHLTTKVRVVFDGSSQPRDGLSLNNQLLTGPSLQNNMKDIVMRWRKHEVVILADIKQMYRQIKVNKEDADYQRIVWRESPQDMLQDYRLLTVTYGTSCAPYLAIRTLRQLAEDEKERYPLITDIILNEFYMDDCLTGSSNIDTVIKIVKQLTKVLQKGGFSLHKWASNKQEVLDIIPKDTQHTEVLEIPLEQSVKTLGIKWHPKLDNFELKISLPIDKIGFTKRAVLSDIAKIFDPLGFLGPIVIKTKIILQKIWLEKLDWDDTLPETLQDEWLDTRREITEMAPIYIQRWIGCSRKESKIELHGFSDASNVAYAAVVYCRIVKNDSVTVSIVEAKTKVAPVKQISLPRLELCAAVILANLLFNAKCCYGVHEDDVYAWTDSKIVLAWLKRPTANWNVFVANRVTEIVNKIESQNWHHVKSAENAADVASRGIQALGLAEHSLWWAGPKWLSELDELPLDESLQLDDIPESKLEYKNKVIVNTYQIDERTSFFSKYSTLTKLIRVTAYCVRFIKNCKDKHNRNTDYLSTKELQYALQVCIKLSQITSFQNEITKLENITNAKCVTIGVKLPRQSKLLSLNPYLDEFNLLRVGGRIENAEVANNIKHPIILSKDYLAKLIIADAHIKTLHGGYQMMLNYIRQNYWIFGLKQSVKQHVRNCVTCCRNRAKSMTQFMADLPKQRVTASRPFSVSGIDFAGPILLKSSNLRGNKSQKAYIALFVCMSTKATHLELVSSLDSPDFIAAFKRFVARRGHCRELWSDCGTNFIGANKLLKVMHNQSQRNLPVEILELLAKDGTDWHFIPPGTPHFGGLWEAGVKSTKHHLKRVIGEQRLTFEEYYTLLTQIESCLNSRPLVPVSDDIDLVLTPGHFLIGEALLTVPDEQLEDCKVSYQKRWKLVQHMLQSFWQKWNQEYIVTLQNRYKWQNLEREIQIDNIVLIKDERCPPSKWLLGRVIQKHPGKDGITRVVTVRCKNSTITRPIHKLCPLPVDVSQ